MTEIRTSDQVSEIYGALAKAQAEIENVSKDKKNDHFKSSYATLAGVLDEVRPKLAKHGIAVVQMPVNGEGSNVGIVTRLAHASGQWIESAIYVAPTRFDAQGVGSVLTYLRRYSLMAVAGVGPEDDDGEAAVGRPQQRPQTNGATRTAAAPPPPERPAHLNGVNGASLAPNPEESGEVTAARQRVKMLIGKLDHHIKTAPNDHALDVAWDDAREELAEIEAVTEPVIKNNATGKLMTGVEVGKDLRARYNRRIAELRGGAAA